jgi:hypothetical protein
MRVLVAYGSKMGGTAGIAELIGQGLTDAGFQADVRPVSEVDHIEAYDAVLVGGALYSGHWHRQARRFVKRHASTLRTRPVWLFSSGPLNGSAAEVIPPTLRESRPARSPGPTPATGATRADPRLGRRGGRWSWCRLTLRIDCMRNRRHEMRTDRIPGGAPWP